MKIKKLLLIPIILFIQSAIASSYTYVTDSVDIPIRSSAKIENNPSNVIRMVSSGDKLETLSVTETGWTQVKSADTTGWAISRYLTSKEPSVVQLRRLNDSNNSNKSSASKSGINIDKVIVNHNKKIQKLNKRYKSLLNEIDQLNETQKISDAKTKELLELLEFKQTNDIVKFREIKIKLNTLFKVLNVDGDMIDSLAALTISVHELEEQKKLEVTELAIIQSELMNAEKKVKKETVKLINIQSELEKTKAKELYVQELKLIEKKSRNERYKEQQRLKKFKQLTSKAEKKLELIKEQIIQAEKNKKVADEKAKEAEKARKETEIKREKEKEKFKNEQANREIKRELQLEEDVERLIAQEDMLYELKTGYINQIASRVKSNWRYQGAEDNWSCQVFILQDTNGIVESVNLGSCNIGNSAMAKSFKDSIERAIYKSSPLPKAPDAKIFDKEIFINFSVN